SDNMSWYPGSPLLKLLNTVTIDRRVADAFRFQVQYVNRPNLDFRGFSGTVASGDIRVGDIVAVLPSGKQSQVKAIVTFDGNLPKATAGMAVTLTLTDEIDIGRGDMLVRPQDACVVSDSFVADVVWMAQEPLYADREYLVKAGSKLTSGYVRAINFKVDVNTLQQSDAKQLLLNEMGECRWELNEKIAFDQYDTNRNTGAFIIIDRFTNATVGAGMIRRLPTPEHTPRPRYSEFELEFNALIRKQYPHWNVRDISQD
ncbi:MAG: sulfate adenylyltransferase subunit 1, partial [Shewanella sp.]|nr:sulfate adenylyltransferase subunit 1 [Shewanella sp.]